MSCRLAVATLGMLCFAGLSTRAQVGAQPDAPRKPAALLAFEASRKSIASGSVRWATTLSDGRTLHYESQYARNGDMLFANRGDDDGWVLAGRSKHPELYLRDRHGWWSHRETSARATLVPCDSPEAPQFLKYVKDVRFVGVAASPWSMNQDVGFDAVWNDPAHAIAFWEEEQSGDRVIVRGHTLTEAVFEWVISPQKGWNAERIRWQLEGDWQEATCELKKLGDIWLPTRTEYQENGRTVAVVRIDEASLNLDSDAAALAPQCLGLEPGMRVLIAGKLEMGPNLTVWDGDKLSNWGVFVADVKAGRRAWGPTMQRVHRTGSTGSPYALDAAQAIAKLDGALALARQELRRHEGLWETYVRRFIARYALDPDQSQKALQVLSQAQQRGRELLSRVEKSFLPLQTELQACTDAERRADLERRIAELRAPIDAVFEEELKPRLERLPTREQRRRAGESG